MEFFDKLTKKASETYKEAAEKTSKFAKEAKLKFKINDNKSKIEDIYTEIGKKVYQKHVAEQEINIKQELEDECTRIDVLSAEIETYFNEILELSDLKQCTNCHEKIEKNSKFCPECGVEQPVEEKEEVLEGEIIETGDSKDFENTNNEEKVSSSEQSNEASEKEPITVEDKNNDNKE